MSGNLAAGKDALKKALIEAASSLEAKLSALCDSFYRNPETGLEERETSAALQSCLESSNFRVENNIAGLPTAFRASFGKGGPVIALLAEMDALPGIGHGCGHNIVGTASVGAALALKKAIGNLLEDSGGTLLVLGTPAEELGRGKIDMLKAGVFDRVDVAMMVHPSSKRAVMKHFLGLKRLVFTFTGRASHASAYPEEGINALDAVIQTFNSINALRQQLKRDCRVHGIITDGGSAPNIIPDRAEAMFYVRAPEIKELDLLKDKVIKCADGAAAATGASLTVSQSGETNAPMKLNHALAGIYRASLEELGLAEDSDPPDRNVGSSDIGNVSQAVAAIHPNVPVRKGIHIHTREFADATISNDGHKALMEGVKCLGLTALELFIDPDAVKRVRADFYGQ
ncbi:MAG: M20 family metallopeptidase [Deltaproteobacteria bacterium]|nr:M20 family metallopeptidase [Deltaproteobacteria bacterium]